MASERGILDVLMERLSSAWAACDAEKAASLFTVDAVYMEPPDRQLFVGRDQLTAYFSPLRPGTYLDVHSIWFDEESQTGAVEFTFGVQGGESADHGIAVVQIEHGRIALWREYHYKGPLAFSDFTALEGKEWEWHAGNYP